MPRHPGTWKNTTFDLNCISIKTFQKLWDFYDWNYALFTYKSWSSFNAYFKLSEYQKPYIKLSYDFRDKSYDYKIYLEKVKCNFWWYRYYFICPKLNIKVTGLYLWSNWYYLSRNAQNLCYETQLYWKRQRAFNKLFNWDDACKIEETIKYPFRNWKPTRKYLKVLKLRGNRLSRKEYSYFID